MKNMIISTPVNISEFDIYDDSDASNKTILFHASGNLERDIDKALYSKNNKYIIIFRLFNIYQSKFTELNEIINVYNIFNNKIKNVIELYESFCDDVTSILGMRMQNNQKLENSKELGRIVLYSYEYVSKGNWERAQGIEMSLGGISNGLGKAFIDKIRKLV